MDVLIILAWSLMAISWTVRPSTIVCRDIRQCARYFVIGAVYATFVIFFVMPPLTYLYLAVLVLLPLLAKEILGHVPHGERSRPHEGVRPPARLLLVLLAIFLVLIGAMTFAEPFNAGDLHDIPAVAVAGDGSPPLIGDVHIRQVSSETALWRADKVVGIFGDRVGVEDPHIQRLDGSLVWLVPFDYSSLWKAFQYAGEGTGGYAVVPAEDALAEASRVTSHPLLYTPKGVFWHRLTRTVYLDYPGYYIGEHVFQLSADGRPVWVTMLSSPTIWGYTGERPAGIVVTDAGTGRNTFYPMSGLPAGIERTMDERLTEQYLVWWGLYVHGWWNSWLGQLDVKRPTGAIELYTTDSGAVGVSDEGGADVFLVEGTDGRLYWFAAISTPGKDTSMVGYVLTDIATGASTFYPLEGVYNDIGAAKNVQQDPDVSKVMGLSVVQPILYRIDGEYLWIVPVISQQGEAKLFGVVKAGSGATFVGESLDVALAEWRTAEGREQPAPETDRETLIAEIRTLIDTLSDKIDQLDRTGS